MMDCIKRHEENDLRQYVTDNKLLALDGIKEKITGSYFNRHPHTGDVSLLNELKRHLKRLTNPDTKLLDISSKEILKNATPGFQRDNNKWSKKMATKYVENILMGYHDTITLYSLKEHGSAVYTGDAYILDGLQRTTALLKAIDGKILPFGFTWDTLCKAGVGTFHIKISLHRYDYDNLEDVGRFYVHMNENITHSKKDIKKAKDWFLKYHNIIL